MLGAFAAVQPLLAAENASALSRISGTMPEYPPIATRYHVQGAVVVRLTVGVDGRVARRVIESSSADVLSRSILNATADWVFTKPEEPVEVTMRMPFVLDGGDYAYDTAVRSLESVPGSQSELGKPLVPGWCEVNVIVDAKGVANDRLVLRMSSPDFRATSDAILDSLRFAAAPKGTGGNKKSATNGISIRVSEDLQIRITQRAGDTLSPEIPQSLSASTQSPTVGR
jgi:TonB family protein